MGMAADTERGLVVPVLHDAHALGLTAIARRDQAARSGGSRRVPSPSRSSPGATIALSNTGSYGSEARTPILSPGTSVTLAIGEIAPRALVLGGEIVAHVPPAR